MNNSVKRRHAHMVDDPQRTRPLLRAVREIVHHGDTVIDIGTGTGILAIAAVKAGAKHVVAVDCDADALKVARQCAKKAGVADKIIFVEGLSSDLHIPKRANLIICEAVGSFAFDENILATIADAKKRLLKRRGRIIPQELELWGAPIDYLPQFDEFNEVAEIKKGNLLSSPVKICAVRFSKPFKSSIRIKCKFKASRNGVVKAIAVWPKVAWWKGHETDASPLARPTHWKQGILPTEPRNVKKGEEIMAELIFQPHPANPIVMTERLWRLI